MLLQAYLVPFYFLLYMMFFRDPIGSGFWKESDFNNSVKLKSLDEVYNLLGEPDLFEIRDELIILDYNDLVYAKEKKNRYSFVRLVFFNQKDTVLFPKNIYFMK